MKKTLASAAIALIGLTATAHASRVPTPVFESGHVEAFGQTIRLGSGGCQAGPGTGGFRMNMGTPNATGYGCWTQRGHIIEMTVHYVSSPQGVNPVNFEFVADIPNEYY